MIPCTSSLILPRWRTEGFDFSDIRKSRRSRNSIVLSRDSVQGLTSKSTRKTGNIERRKKSRLMSRAIYCDKRRIKLIIFVVFRIHFWREIRARPHGNNTSERWKKKRKEKIMFKFAIHERKRRYLSSTKQQYLQDTLADLVQGWRLDAWFLVPRDTFISFLSLYSLATNSVTYSCIYIYIYFEHNFLLRYFPRDTREAIKFENGRNKGATKVITVVYGEEKNFLL